jgi:hypothetical protein
MRDFGEIEFFPRLARFRADMMAPSDISREWNADLWYPACGGEGFVWLYRLGRFLRFISLRFLGICRRF